MWNKLPSDIVSNLSLHEFKCGVLNFVNLHLANPVV